MSRVFQTKTSFTAGEVSPDLYGRGDLASYDNGAARLRNLFIHPTGGVTRRAGLRYLDTVKGAGRLVDFEFNTEQVYLLVLTDKAADVYMEGVRVAGFATPWSTNHLPLLNWTQSADTLLIVHPEVEPQRITRSSHTAWTISPVPFATEANGAPKGPFNRCVRPDLSLKTSGPVTGEAVIHADKPLFVAAHAGTYVQLRGVKVRLNTFQDSQHMQASILGTLSSPDYTTDWTEQAWSAARGWPASVTFHQGRLVIGGSRDLPNHVWFSRSSDFYNFDPGTGKDDDAIDFAVVSDQVNAVRHVFSGRHLQVFTTGAEWMVSGDPLTPANVQIRRQTRIGSPTERSIRPRDVDGATLFLSASGRELREFLFADVEQAYQAADLALLARHLLREPRDMDYDPVRRLVHIVAADGGLLTVTNFRREQVTGWTRQETEGAFLAVCVAGTETYVLVQRGAAVFLEVFDDTLKTDAALVGSAISARLQWSGLSHLEGRSVTIKADGAEVSPCRVSGGGITLDTPVSTIEAGLPFQHEIEPLPPSVDLGASGPISGMRTRLVRASFRVLETPVLSVDTGRGPASVPFKRFGSSGVLDAPPPAFTGDAMVRALGWRRDGIRPLWRIAQSDPLPFTLLSVTAELKVSD